MQHKGRKNIQVYSFIQLGKKLLVFVVERVNTLSAGLSGHFLLKTTKCTNSLTAKIQILKHDEQKNMQMQKKAKQTAAHTSV